MKIQINESEKQRIKKLYGIHEQNWFSSWIDMIGDYFTTDEPEEKPKPVSTSSSSTYITPVLNSLVDHIKKYEEFVPFAYYDGRYPPVPASEDKSKKGTLTIGYGTTDPKYAKIGNTITEKVAGDLLKNHLNTECKRCIESWKRDNNIKNLDKNIELSLMDIIYVRGCSGFRKSNVATSLENKEYKQAAEGIKNGNWGNPPRRNDNVNKFFCKSGLCK